MRRIATFATTATLALAAGCGGTSSGGGTTSTSGVPQTSTHNVSESDNGHTLDVHFGDTIIVTLHSTYWTITSSNGLVLQPVGPPQTGTSSACAHSVPGSGCGTVSETFDVGHVGTAKLLAHRDSCGEALRCTGSAGDWSVTVNAT